MRHVGVAPMWVVRALDVLCLAMAAALVCVLVRLYRTARVASKVEAALASRG